VNTIRNFRSISELNVDLPVRKESKDIGFEIFNNMSSISGVVGVNVFNLFSDNQNKFHAFKDGEYLFYDSNHLSRHGAHIVWHHLDGVLSRDY